MAVRPNPGSRGNAGNAGTHSRTADFIRGLVELSLATFLLVVSVFTPGCAAPNMFLEDSQPVPDAIPLEAVHRLFHAGGTCSGVAIDEHTLLTARHCTVRPEQRYLTAAEGELHTDVELLDMSETADLATLQLVESSFSATAVIRTTPMALGERAYVVGYGCEDRLEVRSAHFAGNLGELAGYLFSGRACFGDSGGPVFDADGFVVAIAVRKTPDELPHQYFWADPPGRF